MELLNFLLQRNVIITLAISGAAIATLGNVLLRRDEATVSPRLARLVLRTGYAISWGSVAIFVATGLLAR